MKLKSATSALAMICVMALIQAPALNAAEDAEHLETGKQRWSFSGVFGSFDAKQLRRGYQVYKEVCAACHSMNLLSYRNLAEPGGPEFSEDKVKEMAAEDEVAGEPDEDGEPTTRQAKPFDRFKAPYKNDNEARSANNGAFPPDLSVIAKARALHRENAWYKDPVNWVSDVFSSYQESGADYLYALLVSYRDEPAGFKLQEGMNYNTVFAGNQIAMPQPLSDESVEYKDGTEATLDNHAKDVTAFLMWAAEPHMNKRKRVGFQVFLYLAFFALLMYLVKRTLWSGVKH